MNVSPTSLIGLFSTTASAGSPREERLAAAAEAKARDAKAAFETLKQRRSDVSEDRKAIARQKIEQLKARLQALRAMASVDPQGTARLAAKLARELGAAVKAYAAAGGMVAGASPAVTVPTSGSAAAGAEAGIGTEAGAGDAAPAVAGEASAQDSAATDQTKADGETGRDEAGKQANPYQQAIEEQKAQAQEMVRRSAEKQADTDFMAEVRKLAAELKALVRQAVEKTPGDNDALNPAEARAMKAAIEAMDREVEQAGADLGGSLSLMV
jgi:hypothetical protein